MSEHLPTVTGKELLKVLQRLGFVIRKISGSHHVLLHPDGRRTSLPVHGSTALKRGLLVAILREVKVSVKDLRKYL